MLELNNATGLRNDFLTLLVTQLRNQDPMEPVKQDEFISQLAQFSTLEGIEKLNGQFENVLYMQQVLNGFDLVDKTVSYLAPNSLEAQQGIVDKVFIDGGAINAEINGQVIPIRDVTGVVSAQSGAYA